MNKLLTNDDLSPRGWTPPVSWFVSRVLWREIGHSLPDHPEVLEKSKSYIDRVLQTGDHSCSHKYLQEWNNLIEKGMTSVVEVLLSPNDDECQVLRSCSPPPMGSLLSEERRRELRRQVKRELDELRITT